MTSAYVGRKAWLRHVLIHGTMRYSTIQKVRVALLFNPFVIKPSPSVH